MSPNTTEHPARLAGLNSVRNVKAKDKAAWLALFADDAVIEDPVGVSPLDPSGQGHRGKAGDRTLLGHGDRAGRGRDAHPRVLSERR